MTIPFSFAKILRKLEMKTSRLRLVFEFKNTGKTAVIVTNVQGSCG